MCAWTEVVNELVTFLRRPYPILFLSSPPSLPPFIPPSLPPSSYILHPKLACCMDRMSCPLNCAGLLQRTVDWVRWDTIHCHSHWELQSHTSALSCVKSEPSFHWLQGQRVKCKGQCVGWLVPRTSPHSIFLLRCWGTCKGGHINIAPWKPIFEYPSTSVDLHDLHPHSQALPESWVGSGDKSISCAQTPLSHDLVNWA